MNPIRWWKRNKVLQDINNVSESLRKVISAYYAMAPSKRKNDPLAKARLELAAEYRNKLKKLREKYKSLC